MSQTNEVMEQETEQPFASKTKHAHAIPRADIYETDDEVVVLCDMPGVKPDEVNVQFEYGELLLFGKIAPPSEPIHYLNREFNIQRYYRTFTMSPDIDFDKISAECDDGLVTVHLPKKEAAKPKQIVAHHGG